MNLSAFLGLAFPVPEAEFDATFLTFLLTTMDGYELMEEYRIGLVDSQVRLAQIRAIAELRPYQPRDITYPVYEAFEELKDEINYGNPDTLTDCFETSRMIWAWMVKKIRKLIDSLNRQQRKLLSQTQFKE